MTERLITGADRLNNDFLKRAGAGAGLHPAPGLLPRLHRMEERAGEEGRFYWFPLSSVLSPLVPRGERMESLMQPCGKGRLASPCSRMLSELLRGGRAQRLLRRRHPAFSPKTAPLVVSKQALS